MGTGTQDLHISQNPEDPKPPVQLDPQAEETHQPGKTRPKGPAVQGAQLRSQVGSISNPPEWSEEGELRDKALQL